MNYLMHALRAEALKTKRTLTLALAFLAPLTLAFLELAIGFQYGERMYRPGGDSWMTLIDHVMVLWALLMLPLFVTLEMGLLGALEHNNKTWKHIYALPLPRGSIYAAKQLTGMAVIGLSTAALAGMTVGVGLVGRTLLPQLGFDAPIPWGMLARSVCFSYFASWLVLSIQLWVSLRWSSFVVSSAVGVVATVFGVVVFGSKWDKFYPWTLPGVVSTGMINQQPYATALLVGLFGGFLAAFGCGWEATRHYVLS